MLENTIVLLDGGFLSRLATDNIIRKKYYNTKTTWLIRASVLLGLLMHERNREKKGRVCNFYISALYKARLLDSITYYNTNKGV